ncbi:BTB/POZ domain-containing protein 16 isoform X2 [Myxocyprinus asiaticus]|uniref:BTB/POZ domain-containing protein 16 isoform X2 n=1 Tax=Myxocyprinus asiaticus TaxID=70543 RepID=UPI0022226FC5|nr:BTB/POZ domain-containing protein 16 isoform X2 [Myxocyprinus asiaticus]
MHIHWSPLSARNMSSRSHTRSMLIPSHISQQNSTRCVPTRSLCQRTQAGHTNRWQLAGLLGSDLLGQAQVQRAEEFPNKSSSHRKIKSADPMAQYWREDATICPESPLPHLVHPLSANTHTRLCNDVTCSTKLDSAEKIFYFLSRRVAHNAKPDAVLECLGGRWELHCSFISRSDTLYELYTNSKRQRDVHLQDRAVSRKCSRAESSPCRTGRGLLHQKWNLTGPLTLRLSVKEPSITKEALSFALRTLYDPEERPDDWGEGVIATAALLGMSDLFHKCLKEMLMNISASTVCSFHQVSCKFKDTGLQRACERWLELFLVTELCYHIKLKDLTFDLLLKTLCSPRLFTCSEYDVLRAVLYWLFLQLNPLRQTLPSHSAIINFFSRDTRVFLEQPLGQKYIAIFQALRLHGITEWPHLQELQNIRVFPQSCLLHILSKHYHTLYSGGDTAVTDFSKQAVRFGMIVDREQDCCTQTISLYGFYFLLKAAKVCKADTYSFSIERLRHWDTALSQSFIVTRPFCMRSERLVCYQITVQSYASGTWQEHSSGPVNQEFGLCKRRCRSKLFQIEKLSAPILVMFALTFPL